jgi:hypothetical protein
MISVGRKRLLLFVGILLTAFTVLAWPVGAVGRVFRSVMCWGVNNLVMNPDHAPDVARLIPDPAQDWHATAVVWNQASQSLRFSMGVDLHQTVYLPLALFLALVLAGAFTFGRKHFRAQFVLLGILLLLARSCLRYVLLRRQADGLPHRAMLDVLLQLTNLSLGAPLGMAYAFPLLLWLLLFRRGIAASLRTTPSR